MSRSRRIVDALRAEDGIGIVEALTAATILLVGIVSTFAALDGSRTLNSVSERKEVATDRGETELERIRSIPFARLELATAPAPAGATDPYDARVYVSGGTYDWDASSSANAAEPLVIHTGATANADAIPPRQTWTDGRSSGTLDTFVTLAAPGLKRVTVSVRVDGTTGPRRPIMLATLVSQQGAP